MRKKTTRLVMIASILRHISDCAIACFIPTFFLHQYPTFKAEYAFLNALILTFCGFISNLMSGILSDRFEYPNYKIKGYITSISSLISVPFAALTLLSPASFPVAIGSLACFVLLSGGYHAAAVTMVENVAEDRRETEGMVAAWNLYCSVCHSVAPVLFGVCAGYLNAKANPSVFGKLLLAFVCGGYIPAGLLFWRAGKEYQKVMIDR